MKKYKVKIEGFFLKLNLEEGRSLCGVISVQIITANNVFGAAARARCLFLEQLARRKVETVSSGLLESFGFMCGVWELEDDSKTTSSIDPGLVFYKISKLQIPWFIAEKIYYNIKKSHMLISL